MPLTYPKTRSRKRVPASAAARKAGPNDASDLEKRLATLVDTQALLRKGRRIVIAVSGGVDSMVLLHVLHRLAANRQGRLAVAHFNHQLRGKASERDEAFVRATAARLKLPFFSARADVRGFAKQNGLSIEMAARQLRHRFFARCVKAPRRELIAVGHHADDQVELFFLRLLRGSGVQALGGMGRLGTSPADRRVRLVRPLLDSSRAEIVAYARAHRIAYRHDRTNASLDFVRNRIRHELLPLIKHRYQPAVERTILRTMDLVAAEAEVVTRQAEEWLEGRNGKTKFAELPLGIQRRALHLQLERLGIRTDFGLVENLRKRAGKPHMVPAPGSKAAGPGTAPGVSVWRDDAGWLQLETRASLQFLEGAVQVALEPGPGKTEFENLSVGWKITHPPPKPPSRRPNREQFDADKVGSTVVLRHWQAGDRFHPIGMPGRVKLQDFLTNAKIPAGKRRELVIATTQEGEIFWVQDLRISERFKLAKSSKRCLNWHWRTSEAPQVAARG
jgi:tRNA(Ile)-lysidine synthase